MMQGGAGDDSHGTRAFKGNTRISTQGSRGHPGTSGDIRGDIGDTIFGVGDTGEGDTILGVGDTGEAPFVGWKPPGWDRMALGGIYPPWVG